MCDRSRVCRALFAWANETCAGGALSRVGEARGSPPASPKRMPCSVPGALSTKPASRDPATLGLQVRARLCASAAILLLLGFLVFRRSMVVSGEIYDEPAVDAFFRRLAESEAKAAAAAGAVATVSGSGPGPQGGGGGGVGRGERGGAGSACWQPNSAPRPSRPHRWTAPQRRGA